MRKITDIIIHESDTPTNRVVTVADIDSWHLKRGFKRLTPFRRKFNPTLQAFGYHFLIGVDGAVSTGRAEDEVGAHCIPNSYSIGICMAGSGVYNQAQWAALKKLVDRLLISYPRAKVSGHRDWPSAIKQGKTCPGFDVQAWAVGYQPDPAHIA